MLQALIATLLIMWYPIVPPEITDIIGKAAIEASRDHNVPVELILAVIEKESSFNPYSISKDDCRGLMQINRKWWPMPVSEAHSIYGGIWHGTRILKIYLDRNNGNVKKALYGYRGAPDHDYVAKILEYKKKWKSKGVSNA
jgi:soluble lytic murein transglycosylase-like protein